MSLPVLPGRVPETSIDKAMIATLVDRFYDQVRADPVLGPVFAARIEDWGPHLERMRAFWASVMLMTGEYHGQPMRMHLPLPIGGGHFGRWLALFEATAAETCPPEAAAQFVDRARRIAESLELGIAIGRGVIPAKGARLSAPAA